MKKRFIYYITLFAMLIACSDEFTELPAIGALSDAAVQNEAGVDLLLIGAYSALDGRRNNAAGNGFAQTGDNWWLDVLSDDAHKGSTDDDQAPLFDVETFKADSSNEYYLGRWSSIFAGVNRANAVIALIPTIENVDLSGKLAEARFLRGHYNFELQRMYGNVPYISEENYANTEFNQANPGPIWEQIEADFQFAIDNLPDEQAESGRPSSWTAKSYLGKVHLQQSDFEAALQLFTDVIDNGPYALNAEFISNFDAAGENSAESIFAIQFTADDAQSPNGNIGGVLNFPNPGPFGSCCGFYQPSQDLVNAFQTDDDGLPLLDTFNENDVANDFGLPDDAPFTPETGNLDPRLDYTVGRRGINYNGYGVFPGQSWIRATENDISGPYLSSKNVYRAGEEDVNQGTGAWGQQHSGINYNVIRYADLLLMAAEAAAETGNLGDALTWVNLVRTRAKNMTYVSNPGEDGPAANYVIEPYDSFSNQDFAIKAIRHERRLELGMEGHRLFDLRRWDNEEEIMTAYISNESRTIPSISSKFAPYTEKQDLLPIPITAIDLSGGVLNQNSGW
ncbi:RagB/SusD family nutrient uptake outer membrane protein [Aggregatimonas sangjinii]|uniref:RagB/SusD family nutrient uptake outer membrane protein n=1 Tax=Aggregatimonas sangjinii TaxID=2583587 RepID=A0A5B7SSJ5_9FLAO|nr:RagB/SusD family nutrient uptake outer membrane protein [Aggregatimonas sangjinii]QCW99633.1 RagB/SusD family nutrient uptake outer membrane protein [Aggregatimonas sangjinii]